MRFTRSGNYHGDCDPDQEERFDNCSQCNQMMDMDNEMFEGVCYRCEPGNFEEDQEDE